MAFAVHRSFPPAGIHISHAVEAGNLRIAKAMRLQLCSRRPAEHSSLTRGDPMFTLTQRTSEEIDEAEEVQTVARLAGRLQRFVRLSP